jgi:hypothetical protein
VVEADVVDVLGPQPDLGQGLIRAVRDLGQDLVGEKVAIALNELLIEGRLGGALRDGRLVGERPQPPVEVLELDHLQAVDDVDEGVHAPRRAAERELDRVAGRADVDRAHGPDLVVSGGEAGSELGRRLADRRRAVAAGPGLVRLVELAERLQAELLGLLQDGHRRSFPRDRRQLGL